MYRYIVPHREVEHYPPTVRRQQQQQQQQQQRLALREKRWRQAWPYVTTLILANLMLFLTLIIFGLEVASLALDSSNKLSNTASTGAGIWCSLAFLTTVVFMYLLVLFYDSSQLWATFTLVAHLISLVFVCVLISLNANTITPYNTMVSEAPTKIQVLRGQLAASIVMLVFPISYLATYIYTGFKSILRLQAHPSSVHLPMPFPATYNKY